jgi:hypothetical protein
VDGRGLGSGVVTTDYWIPVPKFKNTGVLEPLYLNFLKCFPVVSVLRSPARGDEAQQMCKWSCLALPQPQRLLTACWLSPPPATACARKARAS